MQYDENIKRQVVERLKAGEQRKVIAADLKIHPHTITQWKKEAMRDSSPDKNAAPPSPGRGKVRVKPYHERRAHSEEFKREVLARLAAGERKFELAAELKIVPSLIRQWEKRYGLPTVKRAYVRRAPELPGTDRPIEKSVSTSISLLKSVRGQCNNTDPVHLTAMLVLLTLEGKM